MAFFWFFAGIISVAAGLCYIKRGVANNNAPHDKSCACSSGTCCGCAETEGKYPNADEGIDTTLKACSTTCTCTCSTTNTQDGTTSTDRPDSSR